MITKAGGIWKGEPRPEIQPGFNEWYDDFFELSTDRQIGMAVGPIPKSSIEKHTEGWPPDDAEMFRFCMRAMDAVYLEREEKPAPDVASQRAAFNDAFKGRRR